jgi:poly(A) polymerase
MEPRALADRICRTLREAGHQAYLAGGCVRDILLGREPADYDVATDATPDRVAQLFPHSLSVGARFGVMIVSDDRAAGEPAQVEVATFRCDIGYTDGRHPDRVAYSTSPEEDVKRRDFTINALLLDPETNQLLDFVGGQRDIQAGIIRAIGQPIVSRKTSCAWCEPCVLLRVFDMPSKQALSAPSSSSPLKSIRSQQSAFATSSPRF